MEINKVIFLGGCIYLAFMVGIGVKNFQINSTSTYEVYRKVVVYDKNYLIQNNLAKYNEKTGEFELILKGGK